MGPATGNTNIGTNVSNSMTSMKDKISGIFGRNSMQSGI
jgi:hypothetical protein